MNSLECVHGNYIKNKCADCLEVLLKDKEIELIFTLKKNEKLIKALTFYADNYNWNQIEISDEDTEWKAPVHIGGKLARQTLKEIDNE